MSVSEVDVALIDEFPMIRLDGVLRYAQHTGGRSP